MSEFNIESEEKTQNVTYHTVVINDIKFDNAEILIECLENMLTGSAYKINEKWLEEGLKKLSLIKGSYFGDYRLNEEKRKEAEELVDELYNVI